MRLGANDSALLVRMRLSFSIGNIGACQQPSTGQSWNKAASELLFVCGRGCREAAIFFAVAILVSLYPKPEQQTGTSSIGTTDRRKSIGEMRRSGASSAGKWAAAANVRVGRSPAAGPLLWRARSGG